MQIKTQTAKKSRRIQEPRHCFRPSGQGRRLRHAEGPRLEKRRAQNAKNVTVKWDAFINWMQSQLPAQPKAKKPAKPKAKTAAKSKTAKTGKVIKIAAARNGIKAKKAPAKSAIPAKVRPKKAH